MQLFIYDIVSREDRYFLFMYSFYLLQFCKIGKKEDIERIRLILKLYNKIVNSKISKRYKI